MKLEMKYGIAGVVILLATILLFGCINPGTLVPSFRYGHEASINSTGVYVASGSLDTGWQTYYSIYAFQPKRATVGGQSVQFTVPVHALGNGAYGVFKCPYHQPTSEVYYVLTGTGMTPPDTWKIFELNNPTSLVTVDYQYIARDAVNHDDLDNQVYSVCGGGFDLHGNPTGAPIIPFEGTAVNLSKDFSATVPTCNNNGVCNTGETVANCPNDCTIQQICNNNGVCESPETTSNCPHDCPVVQPPVCGNHVCEYGETTANCALDCPATSTTCSDGTNTGVCSTVNVGMRCTNAQLVTDGSCNHTTPAQTDILTQIGQFVMGVVNGILRFFGLAK